LLNFLGFDLGGLSFPAICHPDESRDDDLV